jgi:hypothetical protein
VLTSEERVEAAQAVAAAQDAIASGATQEIAQIASALTLQASVSELTADPSFTEKMEEVLSSEVGVPVDVTGWAAAPDGAAGGRRRLAEATVVSFAITVPRALAQAAASLVETRRASGAPMSVGVGGRTVEASGIAAPEATVLPPAPAVEVEADAGLPSPATESGAPSNATERPVELATPGATKIPAAFPGRHPVPCKVVLDGVAAADLSGEAEDAFAHAVMDMHSAVTDLSHIQGTSFDDYGSARRVLNVRHRRLEGESSTVVTFDLHAPLNGRTPGDPCARRTPRACTASSWRPWPAGASTSRWRPAIHCSRR